MLLLRLVGILALVSIGVCFVLYGVSRDQRYLRFAWRVFLGTLVFAVLLMLFYAAERFLLVI
jgi:zinc transporter ZupT